MTFIDRLNQLLKENNLTRAKFSEEIGIGKNQIKIWETNNTLPNKVMLRSIASYFRVSVEYLLGETDERETVDMQMTAVDFALSGEIRKLSLAEKQDILDYLRFKRSQKEQK